jgi:ATP phosphoribosyltransferase regulatory subunit
MSFENAALLPNGLNDLLPPEAEKEARVINLLMGEFSRFGYSRVKPPLVEFEETLLTDGPGKALSAQTFRLMDPVSRRMMGVRADTTAQIARIAQSRLSDTERPLRLSYAADILRVNGSQLRPERQFCQVGCEMIDAGDYRDDVEICLMAVASLSALQIENLSIDLSIPILTYLIFEAYDVELSQQQILDKLLQKRDRDGILDEGATVSPFFVSLMDASGVANEAIAKLKNIDVRTDVKAIIDHLISVYQELTDALVAFGLKDVNITIDPLERRGFEYKSGISFTLFSTQARGELGRGGRYNVCDSQEAVGFSLYMDSIIEAVEFIDNNKCKNVSAKTSWSDIKKLQAEGYNVSRTKNN